MSSFDFQNQVTLNSGIKPFKDVEVTSKLRPIKTNRGRYRKEQIQWGCICTSLLDHARRTVAGDIFKFPKEIRIPPLLPLCAQWHLPCYPLLTSATAPIRAWLPTEPKCSRAGGAMDLQGSWGLQQQWTREARNEKGEEILLSTEGKG